MLKTLITCLVALSASYCWAADPAKCESMLKATSVKVISDYASPATDLTVPLSELQKARNYEKGRTVLGLTLAQPQSKVLYENNMLKFPDGSVCMRPAVTVKLSNNPMTVLVAREFPYASCAYNHIYRHEMDHVKAYDQNLRRVSQLLESELRQIFGNKVVYGTEAEARSLLKEAVEDYWLPRAMKLLGESEALHKKIDSPEEYAKANSVCGGSIPTLIKSIKGG